MRVGGVPYRTIWVERDGWSVGIIDQTKLPHVFQTVILQCVEDAERAIREMLVRGAPLIGATGAPTPGRRVWTPLMPSSPRLGRRRSICAGPSI